MNTNLDASCLSHRSPLQVRGDSNRGGSMVILVVFCLILTFIAAALSIDVAYMHVTRAELRTATDAAARAGVEAMGRTQDLEVARQAAIEFAARNMVAGAPLRLAPQDIEIGSTSNVDGRFEFQPGARPPTAMRILGRRTADSPSGAVPLFFGPMFGQGEFQPVQVATAARVDLDVSLVLDISGSMNQQNRWPGLVNAVEVFIRELESTPHEKRCSMSVYSTDASKVVPMTSNLQQINQSIQQIGPNGWTAIGLGMQAGLTAFHDPQARPFALRAMIVMTDGHQNRGIHPYEVVPEVVAENVVIHTITFSPGANQSTMREVARRGGGVHVHATNNAQLEVAFREIARQLSVLLVE